MENPGGVHKLSDYSPRNQQVILSQCSHVTQLAGYRAWQSAGRQVRKGEHGLRIAAPVTEKDTKGERRMVSVRGAVVFDISQTDPS